MTHGLANNGDSLSDSLSGHLIRCAGSKEGKEAANPRRECSHIANPRAIVGYCDEWSFHHF